MNLLSEFNKETANNIVKVTVEKAAVYKQISDNRCSVGRKARFKAVLDSEIRPTKRLVIARRQRYTSFDSGRRNVNDHLR